MTRVFNIQAFFDVRPDSVPGRHWDKRKKKLENIFLRVHLRKICLNLENRTYADTNIF